MTTTKVISSKEAKPEVKLTEDKGYVRRSKIQTVSVVSFDVVFRERQQCARVIDFLRKEGILISGFNVKVKHPEQAYQTSKLSDYFVDAILDNIDVSERKEEESDSGDTSEEDDSNERGSNQE